MNVQNFWYMNFYNSEETIMTLRLKNFKYVWIFFSHNFFFKNKIKVKTSDLIPTPWIFYILN